MMTVMLSRMPEPAFHSVVERMGLIAITHGERASVLPLSARTVIGQVSAITRHLLSTSPQTLEHLKEARLFFEVGMVRIAAERARRVW